MKISRLLFPAVLLAFLGGIWLLLFAAASWYSRQPENYSLIEDGLYIGGDVARPPPGTRAVLNLCEKPDSYHPDISLWEPIADAEPAPDVDWLRRMVRFLDSNRKAGLTTFVHCRNGVSRSGMVVTAYEMFKNHWTRDEALAFVRSKRPEVLPNAAFMKRLADWEGVLKDQPAD